jgi:hypothetical protein
LVTDILLSPIVCVFNKYSLAVLVDSKLELFSDELNVHVEVNTVNSFPDKSLYKDLRLN